MKRAAAIIGPTPSFVRWAIRKECSFRQTECKNLPYDTFRQLRSIRELSLGYQEDRVLDGFCVHPEQHADAQTARGFPIDEVYDLYGPRELLEQTCSPCTANAVHVLSDQQDAWAGCYGWFFSVSDDDTNWVEEFENVNATDHSEFDQARRLWFSIWQTERWDQTNLRPLQFLLESVLAQKTSGSEAEFVRFCDAVNRCIEHGLELQTELVPCGHSDGVTWTIEHCCSKCRCDLQPDSKSCEECGCVASPMSQQKRKVLGLRPYMLLKDLVGESQTVQLLDDFHSRKS